jgi:hypothetical protein
MKFSLNKNKICLLLAMILINVSKIIAFHGSFALWGEPDPPKDI